MKIFEKAILPQGFQASAVACGIKKSGKLDLALFYSRKKANAACVFTANKIQAAPVKISRQHLSRSKGFHAIIANSGNANCFTGKTGLLAAEQTSEILAKGLGIKKEAVLVASTGLIGKPLPMDKIKRGIPGLLSGLSSEGIDKAKLAILTTDTFAKEVTVKYNLGKHTITICGVAKGSGMIAPNLATMLAFILTDVNISKEALGKALKLAVDNSFNCITVDGCMSTNDTVAILANGFADNFLIDTKTNFSFFFNALNTVCLELAKSLIRDAEGASKFIQIKVNGAKNYAQAKRAAMFIANSNLFKTAIYGENPNFGRIAASIGASGIAVKEEKLKIKVSPLYKQDVLVEVWLHSGKSPATVYTCDLTPEYIKINAEYN